MATKEAIDNDPLHVHHGSWDTMIPVIVLPVLGLGKVAVPSISTNDGSLDYVTVVNVQVVTPPKATGAGLTTNDGSWDYQLLKHEKT